ncbi:MAG: proteasome subunit alpha [Actinobacteria bacterium]|jgi:proteasome alpha subunit|nr:proteasome subunit alpha [Actinomycetota bacterium]
MTVPFYVSPEQITRDKADFARKGIARGKSVVLIQAKDAIVFVAENPSKALHKISEIYDRIGFAAVGKYNEFENLRVSGIRFADLRGYAYDRSDVSARSLANAYAQTLGTVFTDALKPLEVELLVAEIGNEMENDEIYRLTFDGSVVDEKNFVAIGGDSEKINELLKSSWKADIQSQEAIKLSLKILNEASTSDKKITNESIEVAILERKKIGRKFVRLNQSELSQILS